MLRGSTISVGQQHWRSLALSSSWPRPPPEAIHLAIFGRHQLIGEPTPTAPVDTLGWAPNPGIQGILARDAHQLNWKFISKTVSSGVGLKALLSEYARLRPAEGCALLERLETHHKVSKTVLGCFEKAKKVIPALRATLEDCNHLPPRSEGWVDIFEQEETTKAKIARIAKHAKQLSKDALAKMVNGME